MTAVGPVCHIPPKTVITPKVPVPIPAVPPPISGSATMQQMAQTINIFRQIILIMTGQQSNNGQPQSGFGTINTQSQPGGSFAQRSQTTQTVRVFQNNDKNSQNYVDVEYVTELVMGNNSTRSTWIYDAAPPSSGG